MAIRLGPAFQVMKTALAAGLAWQLAVVLLHIQVPFFAPLTVILVLQATVADTLQRALLRIGSVIGGVVLSLIVLYWMHLSALTITVTLLVGMLIPTLLRLNPLIAMQVGVTALMVVIMHGTGLYAIERIVETILGAAVAIAVNAVIIPPNLDPMAERRVGDLTELLAKSLRDACSGFREPARQELQDRSKRIENQTNDAREALRAARQSMKYNPFLGRRGARLARLERAMPELEKMAIQVGGILHGMYDLGHTGHPAIAGLGDALRATADCIAACGRALVAHTAESQSLLESAMGRASDSQSHCLSQLRQLEPLPAVRENGAILTDLNRILTEASHAVGMEVRQDSADS